MIADYRCGLQTSVEFDFLLKMIDMKFMEHLSNYIMHSFWLKHTKETQFMNACRKLGYEMPSKHTITQWFAQLIDLRYYLDLDYKYKDLLILINSNYWVFHKAIFCWKKHGPASVLYKDSRYAFDCTDHVNTLILFDYWHGEERLVSFNNRITFKITH
jgi:hypothetical protein